MARGQGTINVKFLADIADLKKGLKDGGDEVGGFGEKMKGMAGNVAGALAGLGVADFLKDATQAAAEDEASQAKLRTSLEKSIGAWDGQVKSIENWITKAQFSKGFADSDLRDAFAGLTEVTHNTAETQNLLGVAMDLSRAKGIPLAQAADILAKAHEGNTKAVKAQLPELGQLIADNASADQIISKVADTVKGQADTFANTATGKTEIFHQKLGELTETIGSKLLPVMTTLTDWLVKITDWFSNLPGPVQTGIVVVAGIAAVLVTLNSVLGLATAAAGAFGITLNLALGPITLIIAAIAAIGIALYELITHWDTVKAAIGNALGWIKDRFTDAKNWIGDRLGDIVGFFTGMPGRIASAAAGMWDGLRDAFKSAINWIIDKWNGFQITIGGWKIEAPFPPHPSVTIPEFTVGMPHIPRLATGGLTTGEGLAWLHPAEVVAPLDRIAPGGLGGTTYQITVQTLDPRQAGPIVVDAIREYEFRNGTGWRATL